MQYDGNMSGICKECVWNMHGISMEYLWICMEYMWNMQEYVKNM